MQKIHKLDPITVTKIAAGEVIDRPASVVKELLENSLDAGATDIYIEITSGGKKSISVSDNGEGISKEDLLLAPVRHATSKITTIDDVYSTGTFGFRGEALASISHVSTLTLLSKTREGGAYSVTSYLGETTDPLVSTRDQGTTVTVEGLFENVPVRAKFLKTSATETSYIYDCVLHYALLRPDVGFVLISDQKEMINSRGIHDLAELVVHFFGKTLIHNLIPIHIPLGDLSFTGIMTAPTMSFPNRTKQVVGLNGRLIKSQVVLKALQNSLKDIFPPKRYPLLILNIHIPTQLVDVNVHPQKLDVKFLHPGFLFDALPKAIHLALQTHHEDLKAALLAQTKSDSNNATPSTSMGSGFPVSFSSRQASSTVETPSFAYTAPPQSREKIEAALNAFEPAPPKIETPTLDLNEVQEDAPLEFLHLFSTYLAIKTPDGFWILDQHAVHERILYEKIKENFGRVSQKQPMLISEIMGISPDLMGVFETEKENLEALNFTIEPFGDNQIIIREVPIEFADANITTLLLDYLEQVKEMPGSSLNLTLERKEKLQMQACKAAIKAGKRMDEKEVKQLVKDFIKSPSNYTCPHGRPLFIKYTRGDLEKLFLRT